MWIINLVLVVTTLALISLGNSKLGPSMTLKDFQAYTMKKAPHFALARRKTLLECIIFPNALQQHVTQHWISGYGQNLLTRQVVQCWMIVF